MPKMFFVCVCMGALICAALITLPRSLFEALLRQYLFCNVVAQFRIHQKAKSHVAHNHDRALLIKYRIILSQLSLAPC